MFSPEPLSECAGTQFGIIIGSSGSRKTFAVREACNNNPEGILCYEISEPTTFGLIFETLF